MLAPANVTGGARVLDLGCGQGNLTLALLARGAGAVGVAFAVPPAWTLDVA